MNKMARENEKRKISSIRIIQWPRNWKANLESSSRKSLSNCQTSSGSPHNLGFSIKFRFSKKIFGHEKLSMIEEFNTKKREGDILIIS